MPLSSALYSLSYVALPALAIGTPVLTRRPVRRAELAGLGFGLAGGVVLVSVGRTVAGAGACAAGYLLGLVVSQWRARPASGSGPRVASLRARRIADYSPRWALWPAAATTALTVGAALIYSLAPGVRYRGLRTPQFTYNAGTTTWPTPLATIGGAAFAVLIMATAAVLLRRIASRPAAVADARAENKAGDGGTGNQAGEVVAAWASNRLAADQQSRRRSSRAVAVTALGTELLVLGLLLVSGGARLTLPAGDGPAFARLAAHTMTWAGIVLAGAALVSWSLLGARSRGSGPALQPAGGQADGPPRGPSSGSPAS